MSQSAEEQNFRSIGERLSSIINELPKLNKQLTKRALLLRQSVMKNSPSFPVIAFTTTQSVKICSTQEEISTVRLSDFQYQSGAQFIYDIRGNKWAFQYDAPPFPINFWTELRNPEYSSRIQWKLKGRYALGELKEIFFALLEKNDDVLTEHESSNYLKGLIDSCNSFEEVLEILKKYVFEVNERELWHEQENRNQA